LVDKRFILKRLPILLPIKSPLHNTLGIFHLQSVKTRLPFSLLDLQGFSAQMFAVQPLSFHGLSRFAPKISQARGAVAKEASRRYDGADPPAKIGVSQPEVQRLRV